MSALKLITLTVKYDGDRKSQDNPKEVVLMQNNQPDQLFEYPDGLCGKKVNLGAIAQICNNPHHYCASALVFLLPLPLWIAQNAATPVTMRFNRNRHAFALAFIPFSGPSDEVAQMLQYLICVSRDTPFPGAHFEQVTEQRLGTRLHRARIESH